MRSRSKVLKILICFYIFCFGGCFAVVHWSDGDNNLSLPAFPSIFDVISGGIEHEKK
ncbi:TPA: hypothetical protein R1756_001655 [Campylobacter jejuni]|nr:hypothetical protein [Campylobacter jejuni]